MDNSKYMINITKPPTYIKALTRNDEDIILVHYRVSVEYFRLDKYVLFLFQVNRNEENDCSLVQFSPSKSENSKNESILDTTGSPLKYSFDNSAIIHTSVLEDYQSLWLKEEEKHYPLTVEEAR